METTSVRCNSCGAALDVGAQTRFVTCRFCQSQLEVKHTDTSSFTEIVKRIEVNTDKLATQIKVLELQNELERLEHNWDRKKQSYYTRNKDGSISRPSPAGAVLTGIFVVGFLIFWIVSAASHGAPAFFVLFGFAGLVFAVINIGYTLNKSAELEKAEARFKSERQNLIREIDKARTAIAQANDK